MASAIDATKPGDATPAVKADLRANLAAAKSEIEALQTTVAGLSAGGGLPVFIDAVAQYGAVGNGSTDNSTALIAMRDDMLAAPGRHYVIFFEPGVYHYTNNRWLWNVQSFEVLGHGCTFCCTLSGGAGNHVNNSQPLLSEDPWVDDGDVMYSAVHAVHNGYLINTAAAGVFSVTCTTHAEAGNFAAGNRVLLHGFAQQLGGTGSYPPNSRYFEYLIVDSANASTGVVTFRQALKFMYDSAWYDTTTEGNAYWGKPRLMQLERATNTWPKLAIFSGGYWAADPNDTRGAGDEGFSYCAEVLLLRDLTLDSWWPRFHRYARADNCQILLMAEGDKLVDTLVLGPGCVFNGGSSDDSFRECTGVQNLLIDGVTFHDCVRIRPRRGIIRNSVIHGRSNNAGYVLDSIIYATQELIIENTQLINHHSALLSGIALNDIEGISVVDQSGANIRLVSTGNNPDIIAQRIEIGTVMLTRDGTRGGTVTNITHDGTYFVLSGDWYAQPQASDVLYWSCMGNLVINRVTLSGGNKAPLLYDKFRSYPNKVTRYEYTTKDIKWTGEDVLYNYVRGRVVKISVSVDSVYTGTATTAFLTFYTDDSGTGGNQLLGVNLKVAGYREVTLQGGVGQTNDTFGAAYVGTWVHWMSVQPYGNGALNGLAAATYAQLPKLRIVVDVMGPMA